ncbi:ShlB/FhaC/HecB family hemolysin secretion/activation protein [Pseudoxanthomonas suwonensis]|uniref:ShlB/FhaC/HecB family hemolysin secretion/activation protein n=1 Tax=Pseudoxanthomonas suwonensis TaxID=314722 RepID=UPI001F01A8EE|nr:ShlB/FhaC/HecB family hemolysin secretion/activation protein [Pseudoxanthomonas suwonensis]
MPVRLLRGLVTGALAWAGAASAQSPPDAGQLQRQSEQALDHAPPAPPPATALPAPAEPAAGPAFTVRRFLVRGATLVPAGELERQLDAWRDRPVHLADLEDALRTLVAHYRGLGWFARAQLPEQDITDGTVVVQVVEGRFGQLHVEHGGGRARSGFVAGVVARQLQPGAPYSLAQLERGLLLANDLPGIMADGVLRAGEAPGTSDLVLQVQDRPLLSGSASLGNDGSRYTGRAQAIARLNLDDPSGWGDQIGATLMRGVDLEYLGASYGVPLGTGGWRGNVGYASLSYRLGKEFAALDAFGKSRIRQASVAYPLRRSDALNVEVELAWTGRHQWDESLGLALRRRHIGNLTLGVYGDARDEWLRGGWTAWIVDLAHGRARLDLPDDRALDAFGAGIHGPFTLASLELRTDRWLSPDWYARSRITGQWTDGNLDSSLQFVLGGPSGVRGYPVNEGSGDSGAVVQLELHRLLPGPLGSELDGFAFVDHGVIRQRQDPWDDWRLPGDADNQYALSAAGIGLGWTHPRGLRTILSLASPLGTNPGGLEDRNQDGTRRATQFWFNLRQRF